VELTKNYDEDELMLRSLQAGARGYLLKDSGLETVLQAIERAARGELLLQPELMQRILDYAARRTAPVSPHQGTTMST
jgi:NarL family two-component system response regulator YdfI